MLLAQLLFEEKVVSSNRLVFTFRPHLKYLSKESNYLLSVIFEEIEREKIVRNLERTQVLLKITLLASVTCSQNGKRFQ